MKIEVSYNLASLHAAAAYVWDNNPAVKQWPSAPLSVHDVMDLIHADLVKYARQNARTVIKERETKVSTVDEWITHTGTGGYYIMYDLYSAVDDEIVVIGANVLVDPGVGTSAPRYTTEGIDIPLNTM